LNQRKQNTKQRENFTFIILFGIKFRRCGSVLQLQSFSRQIKSDEIGDKLNGIGNLAHSPVGLIGASVFETADETLTLLLPLDLTDAALLEVETF
jgi:hypothetical protein